MGRRSRVITRIALILVGGAAVGFAVTIGVHLLTPKGAGQWNDAYGFGDWPESPPQGWPSKPHSATENVGPASAWLSCSADSWPPKSQSQSGADYVYYRMSRVEIGWPFAMLTGWSTMTTSFVAAHPGVINSGDSKMHLTHATGSDDVKFHSMIYLADDLQPVPTRIMWPGCLLNVLAYSAVVALIGALFGLCCKGRGRAGPGNSQTLTPQISR